MTSPASAGHAGEAARVVLLSPGGSFCNALLRRLAGRGVRVRALVLYRPAVRAGLVGRVRQVLGRARTRLRATGAADRVLVTGPLNGDRMLEDLRRLRPDWIVVAHCGLLDARTLETAREAVLNVHPGLLPWIRGNDALRNSLLSGVALGATAYRLDAGIDTGGILERRLLPVLGTESYAQLRAALESLWVEMSADLVERATRGAVPAGEPQGERHPLLREVRDPARRAAADELVRAGAPAALYRRWQDRLASISPSPVDVASHA